MFGEEDDDVGGMLERAANDSGNHDYGSSDHDRNGDGLDAQEAFGWDGAEGLAKGMAGAGFADADISESLANHGYDYGTRAGLVGPIDGMVQGEATRMLAGAANGLIGMVNPVAGLASSLGDSYLRGQLAGDQTAFGGQLGSLVGRRMGVDIGAQFGPYGALGGLALGGLAGSQIGKAVAASGGQGGTPAGGQIGDGRGGGDGQQALTQTATAAAKPATAAQQGNPASAAIGTDFMTYLQKWGQT